MKVRPAIFRARPFATAITFVLFATGFVPAIGLFFIGKGDDKAAALLPALLMIPPLMAWTRWWLVSLTTTLKIEGSNCIFNRGILTKNTSEIRVADIRNIQLSQSLFQRMVGVGNLAISSAGQSDVEIRIFGIPKPVKVKEHIDSLRS